MRVLVVEDDLEFVGGVIASLEQDGYACDSVPDATGARLLLEHEQFELIILDIGLLDGCGVNLLRWQRAARTGHGTRSDVPVVVVSARDTVEDRLAALDAGCDDYLVKPIDKRELTARVRTVLRRAEGRSTSDIVVGGMTIDTERRRVRLGEINVELSSREFALLRALAARPGSVLSKAQLENALHSASGEVESNAIEVHIHNLRKKLGDGVIRTLRGAGYALRIDS